MIKILETELSGRLEKEIDIHEKDGWKRDGQIFVWGNKLCQVMVKEPEFQCDPASEFDEEYIKERYDIDIPKDKLATPVPESQYKYGCKCGFSSNIYRDFWHDTTDRQNHIHTCRKCFEAEGRDWNTGRFIEKPESESVAKKIETDGSQYNCSKCDSKRRDIKYFFVHKDADWENECYAFCSPECCDKFYLEKKQESVAEVREAYENFYCFQCYTRHFQENPKKVWTHKDYWNDDKYAGEQFCSSKCCNDYYQKERE